MITLEFPLRNSAKHKVLVVCLFCALFTTHNMRSLKKVLLFLFFLRGVFMSSLMRMPRQIKTHPYPTTCGTCLEYLSSFSKIGYKFSLSTPKPYSGIFISIFFGYWIISSAPTDTHTHTHIHTRTDTQTTHTPTNTQTKYTHKVRTHAHTHQQRTH